MEDKYFNEFFDKLYNGKLNIYEDEEDVNLNEVTKTPERNFNDFLRDVEIALEVYPDQTKLKKMKKESLNTIINPDVRYADKSVYSYASGKNRKETIDKFNEWCNDNSENCKKLKEMVIDSNWETLLNDVKVALDKTNLSKTQKQSLNAIINPDVRYADKSVYSYAKQKNREGTQRKFNDWCNVNTGDCKELKEMFPTLPTLFDNFLIDVKEMLNQKNLSQKQKQSLIAIIFKKDYVDASVIEYAKGKNRKETIDKFNEWCNDNSENCEEIKEKLNELLNKKKPYWKKFQESFAGLFNYDSDENEGTQYFKEKEWKNPHSKKPQDESLESESQIHTIWDDNDDVNLINFINEKVNECYNEVPKSSIIPKTIKIGGKKYLRIKLKKGVSCPLSGNPKKIPDFKEWLENEVVKKVKNHVLNYLKTDGVKVKKFDLECVTSIGDVIKEGFKIEVKHQRKLDGRFANYITSAGNPSNVPSVLGREIYKEFVYTLLGRDKEGKVNVDKDSKFIYDKIIEDNCKHFDGMFIGESETKKDKLIIYVPKEYIKFYISTESQRSINFTLRYHINPENVDNFYKVVRPEDYKNDNKYSNDLEIKHLDESDKKNVKRWRSEMVNPIYMYDGDGLCPEGQSVDESYDSYLDQLVENFFNSGKFFS